ncbi:MAG: hypothetical protein ACRDA5_06795, partial [Clostridium sp.]
NPKIQIIDDNLYYSSDLSSVEGVSYSGSVDICKLNLKDLQTEKLVRVNSYGWVLSKSNEMINLVDVNRYGIGVYKDILKNKDQHVNLKSNLWNVDVIGISNEDIYYESIHLNDAFLMKNIDSGVVVSNISSLSSAIVHNNSGINAKYNGGILNGNQLFVRDKNTLNLIDLTTGAISTKKILDTENKVTYDEKSNLFEVNGYLAYFNKEDNLVVDNEVQVIKAEDNLNSKSENNTSESQEKSTSSDSKIVYIKSVGTETILVDEVKILHGDEAVNVALEEGNKNHVFQADDGSLNVYDGYYISNKEIRNEEYKFTEETKFALLACDLDTAVVSIDNVDVTLEQFRNKINNWNSDYPRLYTINTKNNMVEKIKRYFTP